MSHDNEHYFIQFPEVGSSRSAPISGRTLDGRHTFPEQPLADGGAEIQYPYYTNSPESEYPPPYDEISTSHLASSQYQDARHLETIGTQSDYSADEILLAEESTSANAVVSQSESEIPGTPNGSTTAKARLKVVTALEDTSIFLGGLIKHPTESNKHFTILRHSHGLVYYKGPNTSLALSIFSDRPLPVDRRLWLQLKGWTGHTGMAAKALFRTNASWVNVTPYHQVTAAELPPLDERAWQRDIKKFARKASKSQQKHVLRETVIVRIPYEASDGYFRVVLTSGESRRVLCPSPVFRVASTSMSASSLKGASLRMLPIELSVKAAQLAATTVATNAIGPVVTAVKESVMATAPVTQYSGQAQMVWDASGAQDHINNVNDRYDERLAVIAEDVGLEPSSTSPARMQSYMVGNDSGPEPPFPVRLSGQVSKGTGESTTSFSMPTANVDNLPPDLIAPVALGVYFGWAFVTPRDKGQLQIHDAWRQAIISITYSTPTSAKVARQKVIRVYLMHEYSPEVSLLDAKLKLVIMGHLRPLLPSVEREVFLLETMNDIAITRASLSRPAWDHAETLRRVKTAQSERSITDKMVDLRIAGQRQIDKVPVHMLGVRSDSFGAQDRGMHGNGGLWVKRD